MALIVVGLGGLVYLQMRPELVPVYRNDAEAGFSGPAVDSGARIEIERLRGQLEGFGEQIEAMAKRISSLEDSALTPTSTAPAPEGIVAVMPRDGDNGIIDAYAQVVLIANRRQVNDGIRIASPTYLESVFGRPRAVLSDNCEEMNNSRLRSKLVLDSVGLIRVHMLQPAVDSLKRVFAKIEATDPDLYARINTAGSLCVRQIRGTSQRTSTHSFGLSVDLNIDGQLDTLGDGRTQLGLTIMADFFREEGWIWGAGFTREDSMHFEASRDQVEKWIEEGSL
jgi:hypothetical protein